MPIGGREGESKLVSATKSVIAATIGGTVVVVVGHPLDTVKVLLQTQRHGVVYTGLRDCVEKTYKRHGIVGFYNGIASPLTFQLLFRAAILGSYDLTSNCIRGSRTREELTLGEDLLAGTIAGAVAAVVECPVELIKSQAQIDITRSLQDGRYRPKYRNVFHCGHEILRNHGVAGVYQGFYATLLRAVPGGAAFFGSYEAVKCCFPPPLGEPTPTSTALLAGGVAGVNFWVSTQACICSC